MQTTSLNQKIKAKMRTLPLKNSINRPPLSGGFFSFRGTQPWRNIHLPTFNLSVTKWLVVIAAALFIAAPFHSVAVGQTTKGWTDGTDDWDIVANLRSRGAPDVTTTTWTDGNGDWNTAGNWDNGVPNSTTNAVINGSGHTVSLSAAGSTDNLTLASGNTLNIVNNLSLTVFGSS